MLIQFVHRRTNGADTTHRILVAGLLFFGEISWPQKVVTSALRMYWFLSSRLPSDLWNTSVGLRIQQVLNFTLLVIHVQNHRFWSTYVIKGPTAHQPENATKIDFSHESFSVMMNHLYGEDMLENLRFCTRRKPSCYPCCIAERAGRFWILFGWRECSHQPRRTEFVTRLNERCLESRYIMWYKMALNGEELLVAHLYIRNRIQRQPFYCR